MATDWSGDGIFGTIGKAIREYNADSRNAGTMQQSAVSFVQNYIQHNAALVLEATVQSFSDTLEEMIADMTTEAQSVNGNVVTAGSYTFTGTATESVAGGAFTATQMMVDDDVIRIECIVASVGADTWKLTSMRRGQISRRATTGTAYPAADNQDDAGLSFTINSPSAGTYAVGDYFIVGPSTSDDGGIIQTFFRDAIGRTLPNKTDGSETIPDSLATDNSNGGS